MAMVSFPQPFICLTCEHVHQWKDPNPPPNKPGKLPRPPRERLQNDVDEWKCDAFPAGIPDEILDNKHDHRQPYEGDNGIQYSGPANMPVVVFGR